MRDRLFFPLAGLLVLLMAGLALQPGVGQLPTGPVAGDGLHYDQIVIDGAYLNKVIAGGNARTRIQRGPERSYQLEVSAEAGALLDAPEMGPHFRLAQDIELQFSGRKIRVTVRARPGDDQGAMQMKVNYSAGRVGESGWKQFDLQPGFTDFTFEYDVPQKEADQGVDYIALRPVVPEKRRTLLIERIVLERIG
ncbi:MAG TPA: hypothetical protein PKV67_15930 [Hyphomonas sp.]|nr:hypothetical protein [Hyphomonas sp.]HRJ02237.1 hypothetical protein [Hyphomonas sp.]